MNRCLVKICGITRAEDAVMCHEAGADLLGMVLAPSARRVDLDQAAAIRAAVPAARLVGVFTNASVEEITLAVQLAGLDLVQLHGCGDVQRWTAVSTACGRPVMPAVTATDARALADKVRRAAEALLLDLPKQPDELSDPRPVLWPTARACALAGTPVFLAGALDPDNVAEACRVVQPLGVDVCRGTEQAPGIKDSQLVRRFLAAVHSVEFNHAS